MILMIYQIINRKRLKKKIVDDLNKLNEWVENNLNATK